MSGLVDDICWVLLLCADPFLDMPLKQCSPSAASVRWQNLNHRGVISRCQGRLPVLSGLVFEIVHLLVRWELIRHGLVGFRNVLDLNPWELFFERAQMRTKLLPALRL